MNRLAILALLAVAIAGPASAQIAYTSDSFGDTIAIDRRLLKPVTERIVRGFYETRRVKRLANGQRHARTVLVDEVDCREEKYRTVQQTIYYTDGTNDLPYATPEAEWVYALPGTIGAWEVRVFCGRERPEER